MQVGDVNEFDADFPLSFGQQLVSLRVCIIREPEGGRGGPWYIETILVYPRFVNGLQVASLNYSALEVCIQVR
jgi:hypothetical protein